MSRNDYLQTSGKISDTIIRLPDHDLLIECEILAIWRWFHLIFLHFKCWKSAIFLLLVCITYWPRKHTICTDPHGDNFHQVLSWHDHPLELLHLHSCCRYVTWPCDLNLWPSYLEQSLYMASHVVNLPSRAYAYSFLTYQPYRHLLDTTDIAFLPRDAMNPRY